MKKTIIVTGAFSTMGSMITLNLLQNGHQVVALIGSDEHSAILGHPNLKIFQLDLSNSYEVENFVIELIEEKKHAVHAAICIAQDCFQGNLEATGFAAIQHMIDLNFKTSYHIAHSFYKSCKRLHQSLELVFIGSNLIKAKYEETHDIASSFSETMVAKLVTYINQNKHITGVAAHHITYKKLNRFTRQMRLSDTQMNRHDVSYEVNQRITSILSNEEVIIPQQVFRACI